MTLFTVGLLLVLVTVLVRCMPAPPRERHQDFKEFVRAQQPFVAGSLIIPYRVFVTGADRTEKQRLSEFRPS